jgi:S1-C subfamily serine protease
MIMAFKTHHKVLIGSFTTLVIVYMIVNSVLVYLLFANMIDVEASLRAQIDRKIQEVQADTQSKLNDLSAALLQTIAEKEAATQEQISQLKASVSTDFSGIIVDAINSVVSVRTDVAQGTGFIITEDGYILTNAHVLAGGRIVRVITADQKVRNASLIGYNPNYDIAILKIAGEYNFLELENSDNIILGEKVIAIGNPLGLQFSVSEGIVSGVHRRAQGSPGLYVQTDTALNPGNSGGPLINREGKVIGINNFKIGGFEGLGFALESNSVKNAVQNIEQQQINKTIISNRI